MHVVLLFATEHVHMSHGACPVPELTMHQQLTNCLQELPLRDMHTIHHDMVLSLLLLAVLGGGCQLQQQGCVLRRLQRPLLLQHDALTGSRQVQDVQGGQPVAATAMHLHTHAWGKTVG
jgi:hypothetical protein